MLYIIEHVEIIGYIAAGLGTISLLPQLIKIFIARSAKDISLIMYIIIAIDSLLWMTYGISLSLIPLFMQSLITFISAFLILVMKLLWK